MKVLVIARVAHEINRAYCASLGDTSQPAWEDAPEWQQQSAIAGVEMHLANPDATPEQSHESWLAQKVAAGWVYGEVKDAEKKEHPCCRPYDELPAEQKSKDYLFRSVVHMLKDIPDEMVQPAAAVAAAAPLAAEVVPVGLIPVKYIGRRPEWHDRVYGTGLYFTTEQTRNLPPEIARRLLRHADLFEKGEIPAAVEAAEPTNSTDDTDELLEQGKQAKEYEHTVQTQLQDLYDQVEQMGKDSLIEFASTKYRQNLNKRDSVATLRGQVRQFIDQFGAV